MNEGHAGPRLKSLDLQGYKTFASRVVFDFAPTITAIVGPNGSGKSNIADSIRWVLGEQSYSLLRGKKTEDMIFAGSEGRSRAGMASATITFDNADGWLPIDFSEVTVSRRAYRSGENEYLLNGQRVRLRDVSELLARCGLGERTYTIIGQGLVDAALSLKAEERRRLFEEAAGIGLYRSRREESLRRLDHTRRNLDRVRDILTELKPRLRSLERQAKRAQDYDQVRQDLNAALRQWYGHQWYRMLGVVAEAKQAADRVAAERERLHGEERATASELNALRATLDARRGQVQQITAQMTDVFRERETIGRNLAVLQERLRWVTDQSAALEAELESRVEPDRLFAERVSAAGDELAARQRAVEVAELRRRELLGDDLARQEGAPGLEPAQARLRLTAVRQEIAGSEARLAQQREAAESARLELGAAREQSRRTSEGLAEARETLGSAEADLAASRAEVEARMRDRETAVGEVEAARRALETQRTEVARAQAGAAAAEARLQQAGATLDADVEEMLGKAAARGELAGWHGRLSASVRPAPEFADAIQAALGAFAEGFGLESIDEARRAADQIGDGDDAPAAALLVLGAAGSAGRLDFHESDGVLGNAADLARPSDRFRVAIQALLGRTLVVRDRPTARRLLGSLPPDGRIVTRRGDVFLPDGHVILNAWRDHRTPAGVRSKLQSDLGLAAERLRSAEAEADRLRQRVEEAQVRRDAAIAAAERATQAEERQRRIAAEALAKEQLRSGEAVHAAHRVAEIEARLEEYDGRVGQGVRAMDALNQEQARLERLVRIDEVRQGGDAAAAHLAHAEANLEAARAAAEESAERLVEIESAAAERKSEFEHSAARLTALRAERARLESSVAVGQETDSGIEARLKALQESVGPSEAELASAESERSALERRESQLRGEVQTVERRHSQAQIEWARRQEELASLRRRVEDDFGLVAFDVTESPEAQVPIPFEGLVEHLAPVDELPAEYEGHVNRLRLQLRRMGAINPEARKEYQEVRERFDFLTAQVADLEQAESQLQGVIAELDVQMETEFQRTFEAVSREFRETFTRLFGGGSVRLTLTDPDDLSLTGIDIEARLPGRREQGLAMLSGGERSLTACALVFALLRVSPTPFCVLDEVDAMLDESNVARFRDLLRELSALTQFVIITHNRQTVQAAQALYGVSMGPDSASRVISLQLDEAERQLAE